MKLRAKINPDNPKKVDLYANDELVENLFCVEGSARVSNAQIEATFIGRIDKEVKKVKREKVKDENQGIENQNI